MSTPTFVFLFVGEMTDIPAILVRSIRAHNRSATIIQCSDGTSPAVPGVDRVHRSEGNITHIMLFRLASFAGLGLEHPAMYMDADMVCVRPLDPAVILGDADVGVCKREYGMRTPVIYGTMDLSEYAGQTFADAWPYVACCTVTKGPQFWIDCSDNLVTLNEKYLYWFGDQEAIRNVVASGRYKVRHLPESIYGHLPYEKAAAAPRLLHFKGQQGKAAMLQWARQNRI